MSKSFTELVNEATDYQEGAVLTFKNMRITKYPDSWLVETEDVRKAGLWVQVTGTAAGIITNHVLSMVKQGQVKQPAAKPATPAAKPATPAAKPATPAAKPATPAAK